MTAFAIHQHESAIGIHMSPPSCTLAPTSLSPIPPDCHRAPALGSLCRIANSHQLSILHVVMCMFQCHSPKSSHPHPLPQSPKDYSIHLCLFCCLACKVIVTIFLNSIYMRYYTVLMFFFLAYFTLYNQLQFHPPH